MASALDDARQFPLDLERACPQRYTNVQIIGSGGYAIVAKAIEASTGRLVAVKRMKEIVFEKGTTIAKRMLREVMLLQHFSDCPLIVQLVDCAVLYRADSGKFQTLFLIMEFMESDLFNVMRHERKVAKRALPIDVVRRVFYDLMVTLRVIHSAGVLHRDIAPPNVLVMSEAFHQKQVQQLALAAQGKRTTPSASASADGALGPQLLDVIKVCDFGCAKEETPSGLHTQFVTQQFYRAPEVVMLGGRYTAQVDVWAAGCILAELLGNTPLCTAIDDSHQLGAILKVTGKPRDEKDFFGMPAAVASLRTFPPSPPMNLHEKFPSPNEDHHDAVDLLAKLVKWSPDKRLSPGEALHHRFLEPLSKVRRIVLPINEYDRVGACALFLCCNGTVMTAGPILGPMAECMQRLRPLYRRFNFSEDAYQTVEEVQRAIEHVCQEVQNIRLLQEEAQRQQQQQSSPDQQQHPSYYRPSPMNASFSGVQQYNTWFADASAARAKAAQDAW